MKIRTALFFLAFFPAVLAGQSQRPSAYGTIKYVDFGYGLPTYYGDMYKMGNPSVTYRGVAMNNQLQYSNTAFHAGALFPLNKRWYIKPQFSAASIYFQEELRRVFFRNSVFDASLDVQFFAIKQRVGLYLFAGPGASISYKAEIFNATETAEQTPLTDRTLRLSVNGGAGIHVNIWRRIHVFAEYSLNLTGSDRIDGYNGDLRSSNGFVDAPDEKGYFNRDRLGIVRGGIRLPISRPPARIEERPYTLPLSTMNPDPNFDEVDEKSLIEKKDFEKKDKPALYYELGVQKKLRLFTVAVTHARTLDELKRFNDSAKKIAGRHSTRNRTIDVQLLEEATGYTVHFGPFNTEKDARQFSKRLHKQYRNVEIRNNGK
jgi:hypothetical protein